MYLPRFEGAMIENAAEVVDDDNPARGETILVVDDEVSILKSTCTILRSAGYQVHAASTPSEAIELAKLHGEDIDMLLTDVVMPEMTGRALATTLHGSHPHLAFLFMSGYTADVIARQGLLNDDIHFIQKPFTGNDLVAKVHQAMNCVRSTVGIRALGRVAALAAPATVGG
jgi:DNA-binding NtrC family response regulator